MSDEIVKVDYEGTAAALGRFGAGLGNRAELTKAIAKGQLVSVRRTFREQGSPADSWAPLSARTIASSKSKATAGRKILILSGKLLNSIHAESNNDSATVGTNLIYARVQNDGSADRAGAGVGPQARIAGRSVDVGAHQRNFEHSIHYKVGTAKLTRGFSLQKQANVRQHKRFQNIPARRFMVLRPDDPARIQAQVISFAARAASRAGLTTGGA